MSLTMKRSVLAASFLVSAFALCAQEKTAPAPRIEKSAPVEMAKPEGTLTPITSAMPATVVEITGAPDVAPAPSACAEKKGQARLDCLSREVLGAIRAKLDPSEAGSGPHSYPVIITFVVNQFGDMKDIRVEHTSGSDLPKKVIVALYAMPKFVPAMKGGATIGTSVKLTYPFEALFSKD